MHGLNNLLCRERLLVYSSSSLHLHSQQIPGRFFYKPTAISTSIIVLKEFHYSHFSVSKTSFQFFLPCISPSTESFNQSSRAGVGKLRPTVNFCKLSFIKTQPCFIFIPLGIDYGYFCATMAGLSGCNENRMAHKPKIFIIWLFTEECTSACLLYHP